MNPIEILRRAKELKDHPDRVKLLWFLHSIILAEREEEFAALLNRQFADRVAALSNSSSFGWKCSLIHELQKQLLGHHAILRGSTELLIDFMHWYSANVRKGFYLTNVGRPVWETLDWCLEERQPGLIIGPSGRRKSTSIRAWHDAHRGESRYVQLSGLCTQKALFENIATAYGHNFSSTKAPNEIRFKLTDIIVRSGLVLILDEAHNALPERHHKGKPKFLNWVMFDLRDAGVPVVLVSAPQFGPLLSEFEQRTGWNADQFRRRFAGRCTVVPENTAEADLLAIIKKELPHVGSKGEALALGYAVGFNRDVSGLSDLMIDANRRARLAGRGHVAYKDLLEAHDLDRAPSENAMALTFPRPAKEDDGGAEENLPESGESPASPLQRNRMTVAGGINRLRRKPDPDLVAA